MFDRAFEGKVALITGGSSGLGRTTAIMFATAGAKVVVAARRVEEGLQTIDMIEKAGGTGRFIRTDVRSATEVAALVEGALSTYGRLDCAVNNAGGSRSGGTGKPGPFQSEPESFFDSQIAANLKSVWLCLQQEIPTIARSGGGAIVNISSVAGIMGTINYTTYGAAKGGVVALTRGAAAEAAESNVRVNAIAVGAIRTPAWDGVPASELDALAQTNPLKRFGEAEHIGGAALWLCSRFGEFVTGQCITIDGGRTALGYPGVRRST